MLSIIKTKNGYNIYDDIKQKNILKQNYDSVEFQNYGIVAKKHTKDTFLDCDFHLYDLDGNFLFPIHEHYDGNYVVSHSFNFHKKYICITTSCTADYDRWDHGTDYSHSYVHLNGKPFNVGEYSVDSIDEFSGDIYVLDVSKGLWSSDKIKDSVFYDMKNRKVILSKNALLKDVKDLIKAINYHTEQKMRLMLAEKIKQEEYDAIFKHNLSEQEATIYNNNINSKIKQFIQNGGYIDLYGEDVLYDEDDKLIPQNKNLKEAYHEINYLSHWGGKITADYNYSFYYSYDMECYKVDIDFKRTKMQDISTEVDKCYFGNDYMSLNLLTINPKNMEITINARTLNRLKNLYTKLTNKPCPSLDIEKLNHKQAKNTEITKNN